MDLERSAEKSVIKSFVDQTRLGLKPQQAQEQTTLCGARRADQQPTIRYCLLISYTVVKKPKSCEYSNELTEDINAIYFVFNHII